MTDRDAQLAALEDAITFAQGAVWKADVRRVALISPEPRKDDQK